MSSDGRLRLLILVVAYNAEATVRTVLGRVPPAVLEAYDCRVLVIDDASGDRTFELGHQYGREHAELPLTVLRNRANQGYGGNQKVGYSYALAEGFDVVALLHGDGQYAPEELPRLLEPVAAGAADAVLGSRMMRPGGARRGGMPLYKYVGNKVLSRVQNGLAGSRLSEWHSGYRIYSADALRRIPFRLNSDGFAFDTEVILQLQSAGARILELPIPTFYGTEISRVDGVRYARQVVAATAAAALHRRGLRWQRRFEPLDAGNPYDLKLGFPSSHSLALAAVPPGASVLDIGAGPGGVAAELAARGCRVAVVDSAKPEVADPAVAVYVRDLNQPLDLPAEDYDHLLLLDVIEHLADPEDFLERLRARLDDRPRTLILSTPNVAFVVQRLMLLAGQFNYGRSGILDRTHTRLFTFRTLRQLLQDTGHRRIRMRGVPAPFPKAIGDTPLARALLALNVALIRVSRTLFSYQIFVVAEPTPDVAFWLRHARESARGPV